MSRLLTLGIYSVLIAVVLVVGVANASDTVDIVPAKKSIAPTQYSILNTFNGPRVVDATDLESACTKLGGRYFFHSGWNRYVCNVEGGYSSASELRLKNCTTDFNASVCTYEYTCPPADNLDYTLPTSNPAVLGSEGKYCKKPEENKCKQQTLNNPLDEDGAFYLYYYKSSLSGCFDGCSMTFKSDPDAQDAADSGQSVMTGLLAYCYPGTFSTCAGPLMQFDGTQCSGSNIQTAPEPTTSGAEPTTSGAEPTTSGAEPTTSGAEPTTSGAEPTTSGAQPTTSGAQPTTSGATGTDPNCYGTNQGDKCNGTSGSTGTGGGTGSGSGAGSGSGSGAGTGTSGGTGTGSGSGTGDDVGEKAASYCKANPDSVVCAKLGSVDAEKITTDEISVSVTPDSGWGSASAQCPASPKIALDGYGEISINTQPLCDFLMMIRPVIIAVAWLMAAFIMIGWRTSSGED